MPFGNAMVISCSASKVMIPSVFLSAWLVKRWVSLSSSHNGWCLLKSPAHIIWESSDPERSLMCALR